ncbi:dihydrofolate reductase [Candidatus Uhrbacteria bacterium]|nr:dihydrofolate reductase [Candidatus Uhrbacteria bacterium]
MIYIIAAMGRNRVIGKDGKLPWRLPADLKHFKEMTTNNTVVMGRRTYESIGRRLPDRRNIVISTRKDLIAPGCLVVPSFEAALANIFPAEIAFCIGGSRVYQDALPLAEKMYLTEIDAEFDGDVFFPEFNYDEWKEVSREPHEPDEKNPHAYDFVVYERRE